MSDPSCTAATPAASLFCGKRGKENMAYSTAFPKQVLCHMESLTGPVGWEKIRVNLGDKREKVDGKLQQGRKDPSGKVNPLKQLWQFYQSLQGWTQSTKEQIDMKLRQYIYILSDTLIHTERPSLLPVCSAKCLLEQKTVSYT